MAAGEIASGNRGDATSYFRHLGHLVAMTLPKYTCLGKWRPIKAPLPECEKASVAGISRKIAVSGVLRHNEKVYNTIVSCARTETPMPSSRIGAGYFTQERIPSAAAKVATLSRWA